MNALFKFLICFLFFQLSNSLYSQENNGTIIFRLYPVNKVFIKIGDTIYSEPKISLPVGEYAISLWSPHKISIDTTINVFSDSVIYFKKFMSSTVNYELYRKSLKTYNRKIVIPKILSLTTSLMLTGNALIRYQKTQNQWKRVENRFLSYETSSPFDVKRWEDQLDLEKQNYEKNKKAFTISSVAAGASLALTAFIIYKLRKNKKPKLPQEDPPFVISYIPLSKDYFNGCAFNFSLIKKI